MEKYQNKQIQNGEKADNGNEQSINIRDIIFLVLNNWWWFVISVVVCLAVAALLYKQQPKTYTAQGTILVKDQQGGSRSGKNMDAILNSMGMDNSSVSLENEIYLLRSSSLMNQVVQRLRLNYPCERRDFFKKISYFEDAPLALSVVDDRAALERNLAFSIEVTPKGGNKYDYKASKYGKGKTATATFGETVSFDDTLMFIMDTTRFYNKGFEKVTLYMGVYPSLNVARGMLRQLSVSRVDKMASVLSISYQDHNLQRAGMIVDTLIAVYNDDAVEDKNKVAEKTESFIDERIAIISGSLDTVDNRVASIKKGSNLPEIEGSASSLMQLGQRHSEEVNQLETELKLISDIKTYISNPANKEELIPANVGISNSGIQSLIASYISGSGSFEGNSTFSLPTSAFIILMKSTIF